MKGRKISLIVLLIVFILIAAVSVTLKKVNERNLMLVKRMRNQDVIWNVTYAGLIPRLTGPTKELERTVQNITPLLCEALLDEDRYVAAHVLLTFRTHSSFSGEYGKWNGLNVSIDAQKGAIVERNDLLTLAKYWKETCGN